MPRSRAREVHVETFLRLDPAHVWTLDLAELGLIFRLWRVGEATRELFVAPPHWIAETRRLPEKEGEAPRLKYVGAKSRTQAEKHLREETARLVNEKAKRLREQLARLIEQKPARRGRASPTRSDVPAAQAPAAG